MPATLKIKGIEYELKYCSLCKSIVIICAKCENTSCNGGGCDSCDYAFRNSDEILKKALIPGELYHQVHLNLQLEVHELRGEKGRLERILRKSGHPDFQFKGKLKN